MPPAPAGPALVPPRAPNVLWWFLVPLATCGFGSFVMVLVGGVWLRSKAHIAAAIGYFVLTALFFVGVQTDGTGHDLLPDAVTMPALLVSWLGGLAHTIVLSMKVRAQAAIPAEPADPALVAAQWRTRRRQEARQILATDPALGAELRIGRPDLPREYDDGGLVDVNHVPAGALVSELDIPAEVAATIRDERERLGGFSSPDELMVYCAGLTPERLQIIRERLAFIPE